MILLRLQQDLLGKFIPLSMLFLILKNELYGPYYPKNLTRVIVFCKKGRNLVKIVLYTEKLSDYEIGLMSPIIPEL